MNTDFSKRIDGVYKQLMSDEQVRRGLDFIKGHNQQTLTDQIAITSIPAPSYHEEERGQDFKRRFEELGLENIEVDKVGNVFGIRRGNGKGPKLVVSAHLDTVFPDGTDVEAKEKDGKHYAPGIADDGRGLTVVLTLLKTLNHLEIQTAGDIIFAATVGEEGLGDLRGVKNFFAEHKDVDGFISIEPGSPSGTIYLATGSKRYSVTFRGPGGHSFGDFGIPSATHALGRAVAKMSDLKLPEEPKTTFTVGKITGGTSVNTIAAEANMVIDLRSTSADELKKLEKNVLGLIHEAVAEENSHWDSNGIEVTLEEVGDRPAGSQDPDSAIVQTALAATQAVGFEPKLAPPVSTDSNVPISLGIPAVTLGGGGEFGGIHTLEEYFDPTDAYYGPQQVFLTILGLVGLESKSEPLI